MDVTRLARPIESIDDQFLVDALGDLVALWLAQHPVCKAGAQDLEAFTSRYRWLAAVH